MYALDEAWNARDWDIFDTYHDPDHVGPQGVEDFLGTLGQSQRGRRGTSLFPDRTNNSACNSSTRLWSCRLTAPGDK